MFIIACHEILSSEIRPPFCVSKDESFVFSLGGDGSQGSILQSTSSGELVSCYSTLHESGNVRSLTFSVSPDRLWSASTDGILCCFELKRGKKTIQRLQELNVQNSDEDVSELGVISSDVNFATLRLEVSDDEGDMELESDGPPPIEPHPLDVNNSQFSDVPPPIEPHPNDRVDVPPPIEPHPNEQITPPRDESIYEELNNDPILSTSERRQSVFALAAPKERWSIVE